jgi:hypothetical protein
LKVFITPRAFPKCRVTDHPTTGIITSKDNDDMTLASVRKKTPGTICGPLEAADRTFENCSLGRHASVSGDATKTL